MYYVIVRLLTKHGCTRRQIYRSAVRVRVPERAALKHESPRLVPHIVRHATLGEYRQVAEDLNHVWDKNPHVKFEVGDRRNQEFRLD